MRVLLIGAYGFIGSALARALTGAGHEVVCFGRSRRTGERLFPDLKWTTGDLNEMVRHTDWLDALNGVDAVVNASGALQSGGNEKLERIQGESICALIAACEQANIKCFVQISAPGAVAGDPNPFLATKALADERLRRSCLSWTILRPGLVIGRNAYGGTMLIRALAALPGIQICVHGQRRVQCVALTDVAAAVIACLETVDRADRDVDLVERGGSSLAGLIGTHRRWLGLSAPRWSIDLAPWITAPVVFLADFLGHLGWRSPLRSTALAMVARDVVGAADAGEQLLGRPLLNLDEMLRREPAGMQDRIQARLYLMIPTIVGALSLLFVLSGGASLGQMHRVVAELEGTPAAGEAALLLGMTGGVADILLGLAILVRSWARRAALGMAALASAYVVTGSWLRPDMWLDPLAPLAKALAVMMLALVAWLALEER